MAEHWQSGAAATLTVQVPQPTAATGEGTRLERVVAILRGSPGIAAVRVLSVAELSDLLRPWLGNATQASALAAARRHRGAAVPRRAGARRRTLQARLNSVAPGTFLEGHGQWLQRLTTLARSLQLCAAAALLLVAAVGAAAWSRWPRVPG